MYRCPVHIFLCPLSSPEFSSPFYQELFPFLMMLPRIHLQTVFKPPFNHPAELGYTYLAPLTLLYLATTLRGRMLSSNNPSPPALCDHQHTGPLQPGVLHRWVRPGDKESIPPCFTAWNYRDNPKESFTVLRTLYSPSKSGKLIGLTALTVFSLGKKKWHYFFSTQTF